MNSVSYLCVFIFLLAVIKKNVLCQEHFSHTPQPPANFPDLFKMEDYYKCPEQSLLCSTSLKLIPKDDKSALWIQIEDWSSPNFHYNRTVVHRTLCVPKTLHDETLKMTFVENRTNEELKAYNLSSDIYHINCMNEKVYAPNMKMYMTIAVIYLSIMLMATIYDETIYDQYNHTIVEKLLVCFSLTNYKKSSIIQSDDYQRLKCIQSIRTFQTILVVSGHVILGILQKHISNPQYVEKIFSLNMMQFSLSVTMFLLQTYFVISSWLLTYQILSIHEQNKGFSLKDAGLLLIQRIARLWPTMALAIFVALPIFDYYGYGPGSFQLFNMTNAACSKNWWVTFIFGTHFLTPHEMCHMGLWTLSIDSQMYLIILVFFYIVLNFKLHIKKGIAVLFFITYAVNVAQIYAKELDRSSWTNLKLLTNLNFFFDDKTPYIYYGFWINSCSGVIGILFGYIYFHNKKNQKNLESFERNYNLMFIGLPLTCVIVGSLDYSRWIAALLGPLFKPAFGCGIAVGIYGISRNVIKGYFKSICENKYLVLLGNFSFSTYMYHFFFVFRRNASSSTPLEIGLFTLVSSIVQDVVASFIVGVIMTFAFEIPFVYIAKLILPPIWKKSVPSNGVTKNNKCK